MDLSGGLLTNQSKTATLRVHRLTSTMQKADKIEKKKRPSGIDTFPVDS